MASGRGSFWEDTEVRALLSIWGESDIQEALDGAKRNKLVYQNIVVKLKALGYDRDIEQCKNKIKNLKKE